MIDHETVRESVAAALDFPLSPEDQAELALLFRGGLGVGDVYGVRHGPRPSRFAFRSKLNRSNTNQFLSKPARVSAR